MSRTRALDCPAPVIEVSNNPPYPGRLEGTSLRIGTANLEVPEPRPTSREEGGPPRSRPIGLRNCVLPRPRAEENPSMTGRGFAKGLSALRQGDIGPRATADGPVGQRVVDFDEGQVLHGGLRLRV